VKDVIVIWIDFSTFIHSRKKSFGLLLLVVLIVFVIFNSTTKIMILAQ